ncbi:MAG: hypothetical protein WCJ37_01535 [Syntrophus sp. (in: bacteria)]
MIVVGVISYVKISPYDVTFTIKPGSFLSDNGSITPLVTPAGLERLISEGIFNRSIYHSVNLDPQEPLKISTIFPVGTDVILVVHETRDPAMGLRVVNALIGQLSNFYDRERQEKLQTVSSNYMDSIKKQVSQAGLDRMKKLNEIERLKSDLTRVKKEPKRDDLVIKNIEISLSERQKEYQKLDMEVLLFKRQLDTLTKIIYEGKSIQVIQEPMVVQSGYKIRIAKNMLLAAVISLVIGFLLAFILYDLRMIRKSILP